MLLLFLERWLVKQTIGIKLCVRITLKLNRCQVDWNSKEEQHGFELNLWHLVDKLLLTWLVSPPVSEVWFSEPCRPFLYRQASPPATAPLQWVHLVVYGQLKSDQLVAQDLSSTKNKMN